MNVSLTDGLEEFIKEKLDTKLFQTSSEVVREALRRWKAEEDFMRDVRSKVEAGLAAVDRGAVIPGPKVTVASIRQKALARRKTR